MKKLLIGLVAMVCLLGVVGVAYGNSGSAVIPGLYSSYTASTEYNVTVFRISNITNESIDVKIILYKQDGSLLSGSNYVYSQDNLNNYNGSLSDATVSFTLAPNAAGEIKFRQTTSNVIYGHGIIEWEQKSTAVYGLVVSGFIVSRTAQGYDRFLLPINNGLPF